MSINGINGPGGAARIAAVTTTPAAESAAGGASATARSAAAAAAPHAEVKQEETREKATSVHFPWLSRLSAEIEAASKRRARFPTQIMGDHLDKKA